MALQFKDVKQNYPIYIFDKQALKVAQGKVKNISFPRVDFSNVSKAETIVDVTIEAEGITATYAIPDSLCITFANNLVLATEKTLLIGEIEAAANTARQLLEGVDAAQRVIDAAPKLLAELNPIYKERQETEQRFSKIEDSVGRIEKMMQELINSSK